MAKRKLLRGPEANFRALFSLYKRNAKKRRLPFKLSAARFRELTKQNCFVCGSPPLAEYKHANRPQYAVSYPYNGIDRLDNKRGYLVGNVASCCARCNYAKGRGSLTDLLLYIHRAYLHAIKPVLEEN